MASTNNLIGYEAPTLMFNGEEGSYEVWEMRFTSYLRLQKIHKYVMTANDELRTEPVPAAVGGSTADVTAAEELDAEKNAEVFAALIQFLDDKSINLVIRDARNNGRTALRILRDHYKGSTKPRIIFMYCELTSLKLSQNETVTEYILRAETCVARLKEAGENFSDGLLIAMIMKGLPDAFNAFSTVVCQQDQDKMIFSKFKSALRNFEENEKSRNEYHNDKDSVMRAKFNHMSVSRNNYNGETKSKSFNSDNISCYICKNPGHKSYQCPNKSKKWCSNCKNSSHITKDCRKNKNYSKSMRNEDHNNENDNSFVLKVSLDPAKINNAEMNESLLVNCGATSHIINEKDKFIEFYSDFDPERHTIELADSSRKKGIVSGKRKAKVNLTNTKGESCSVILDDALYVIPNGILSLMV